jgi:hypothetical protein
MFALLGLVFMFLLERIDLLQVLARSYGPRLEFYAEGLLLWLPVFLERSRGPSNNCDLVELPMVRTCVGIYRYDTFERPSLIELDSRYHLRFGLKGNEGNLPLSWDGPGGDWAETVDWEKELVIPLRAFYTPGLLGDTREAAVCIMDELLVEMKRYQIDL